MKIKIDDNLSERESFIEDEDILNDDYIIDEEVDKSKGTIEVIVKLGNYNGANLKGAKVNLYLLQGISPKLKQSKFTDEDGKVIFDNLDNGCYRVISIVDRKYFEKPIYHTWNEFTVDQENKSTRIIVINRLKKVKKQ
ncbi:SpaA isopeptide-forming pilin-related protein [Caproiciproducens sp. MSJ-32]|uniref:SpaA isopeptide-forming pilin-related protein n=1 Tax=Caproiciproducens sp. MSJ-32 TaxID=2841527 RepID=UPI001C1011B5|nr:SpaA isopeptide-forming pilin-related protein [Caproiciproducens sp. MSJ-32]MBU5454654.1 MSCRAMM family adhesin SdrC [Caproiciproducens sp. MSJ-32]